MYLLENILQEIGDTTQGVSRNKLYKAFILKAVPDVEFIESGGTVFAKFKEHINEELKNISQFQEGKTYSYDELPEQTKEEVIKQYRDYDMLKGEYIIPNEITTFKYKFHLLNHDELEKIFKTEFGPNEYKELIIGLVKDRFGLYKDIKQNGVKYPAVEIEGNHRMAICYTLRIPCPYFEIIEHKFHSRLK